MIEMERATSGERFEVALDRWTSPATPNERALLNGLRPAVLDVGCGPGRIAAALAESGTPSLGIDVSPVALRLARRSGATVLHRSVFDPLPGEGAWGTVLLLDGNIGIGGDPLRLLERLAALVHTDGGAVVEVEPPGFHVITDRVRIHGPGSRVGPWFQWAWVGADAIEALGAAAGFGECAIREHSGRCFALLGGADSARHRRDSPIWDQRRTRPGRRGDPSEWSPASGRVGTASDPVEVARGVD
jgi:SAM-dependent methyltransferase